MQKRRILAATDQTLQGDHAVTVAQALALAADGEFERLAVAGPERLDTPWLDHAESGARSLVATRGLPGVEIVRSAEMRGAYLVVLGRTERTPGWARPVGAASDTVIRRRNGLTLLVPPHVQTIRRATIALDGTPRGGGVAAPAADFLNLYGAVAHAVCVLPGTPDEAGDTTGANDPRTIWLGTLIERLPLRSGPCDLRVRWGDPMAEILRMVRETASDLLVLGVRRGGLRGDSGSGYIGRELLRSVSCAVLTVPI